MKKSSSLLFAWFAVALQTNAQEVPSSPEWYDEAKFGIFIHWGVYSVPAFSMTEEIENPSHWSEKNQAYSEWYWHSITKKYSPTYDFHTKTYGSDFEYQDFAPMFKAELFDPAYWADIFERSGAKYVVMVAKHHDGYALWPSKYSWNWNSMDVGPHRDLLGDLSREVKKRGLKMGVSYSLDAWFDPLYLKDFNSYVDEKLHPQLKELITDYEPDIFVAGGHNMHTVEAFKTDGFLKWLYSESPVKNKIVVNDRWGKDSPKKLGSYFTTQYSDVNAPKNFDKKWEEMRGIGKSFGYSRIEKADDYMSSAELIETLVKVVCNGGNLLLNIGPTADGRIPVIMQERLLEIGNWLSINGEAIYSTRKWVNTEMNLSKLYQFYAKKNSDLYVIITEKYDDKIFVNGIESVKSVRLLGYTGEIEYSMVGKTIRISFPSLVAGKKVTNPAWVFKLESIVE
ncbi:alpha-L-fucosidase [Ulvibacterium marinum]|uniref:alpha-L-fucosidase n=1 Tax=Ulvibacterium marinum TaxID=2419782 RepID=A0A3B0CDP6_9FLAO|nr:alpha-L-fucosidase [Ulvibacterium marinum]RKN83440.1 alpha-L-fucosidase [Ulvibacterium marinum]